MTHLILTGCTGTAGSALLAHCIHSKSVSQVSVLSRRPVKQATGHEKVRVIIHKDFKSYPDSVLDQLKGATGCVWALGVPSGQVDSDRCVDITTTSRHRGCRFAEFDQGVPNHHARIPDGRRQSLFIFGSTLQLCLRLWGRSMITVI